MPNTWDALVAAAKAHLVNHPRNDGDEVKAISLLVSDLEHQLRADLDERPLIRTRHEWDAQEILEREG